MSINNIFKRYWFTGLPVFSGLFDSAHVSKLWRQLDRKSVINRHRWRWFLFFHPLIFIA